MKNSYLLFAIVSNLLISVHAQAGCSQYTNTIVLSNTESVKYVSTATSISMQLKTTQQAWVGLGRSQSGSMIGSEAVIGLPSSGTVGYYLLDGKFAGNGGVYPSSAVTLSGTSVTQSSINGTVLRFTQNLAGGRFPLSSSGSATFIYAVGCGNTLGFHCSQDSFTVQLSPCVASNPTVKPVATRTRKPSRKPTRKPSLRKPSSKPSKRPVRKPTTRPSRKPINPPVRKPSMRPSRKPTKRPSRKQSRRPSRKQSRRPSRKPTLFPL